MYMLLFCLLAVLSTWTAWRHNPLFSMRATLRFLIAVGGMMAVFLFAILKAARYSVAATTPPALAYTSVFGVTIVGTVAMIWVIMAVSNPSPAALPPAARSVNVFRRRVAPWARRLLWATLTLGALAVVLPRTGRILAGVLGGTFFFLGIICLFAFYFSSRQMDRWLSAVEADPWVHWIYTADQWQRWTEIEVARTPTTPAFQWRTHWKQSTLFLGGMCVAILVLDPGPWYYRAALCVVVCLMMLGLAALGQKSDAQAPARVRATLVKAPPEVYFGTGGLFADGAFTPWLSVSNYLLSASVDERAPRSLLFQFEKTVPGSAGDTTVAVNQYVPIPEGRDVAADLARLQQELAAKCPTAAVRLA